MYYNTICISRSMPRARAKIHFGAKKMIYFDNSASTPPSQAVKEVFFREIEEWGNPSSLHRFGFEAAKRLEEARKAIAKSISALPEEIVFTSGGTEADNLALFGAARKKKREGRRILASDSEHPAVEECLKELEKEGFEVIRLKTAGGRIDPYELEAAVNEETILCAVMTVNNETGAVYDIPAISRLVKRKNPNALVFSDCVQGYLKEEIHVRRLGVDLLSLSSHKIHGPKGVGALYIKKGVKILPCLFGGGQEKGMRNGTENLPGIVAFGEAAREGAEALAESRIHMENLKKMLFSAFAGEERVRFNLPEKSAPHIVSMQVRDWRSEVLLHTLSDYGICVSSGSACSSHKGKSPVLKNFGLSEAEADRTIRISLSRFNTEEEMTEFIRVLKGLLK